jgi:prepilin-type N-terminal cleavage/methylation domain-containing protein
MNVPATNPAVETPARGRARGAFTLVELLVVIGIIALLLGILVQMLLYPYLDQGKDNADVQGNQVWNCPANQRAEQECGYGFNTNLNWVKLNQIRSWSETVAVCDSGLRDGPVPTLSTMCNPPSKTTAGANAAYRPNARHPTNRVCVAFVDAHVETMPLAEPFYPGPVGKWAGNGVVDRADPNFKDQLWDLD